MNGHPTPRRTSAWPESLVLAAALRSSLSLLLLAILACALLCRLRCWSPAAGPTTAPRDSTTAARDTTAATTAAQPAEGTFPVTVTDDNGTSVTIDAKPMRIVSTAPANTETLFALGLGDRVVGVTSLDDYPPEVADIAKIGDFQANTEAIMALSPDLVVGYSGNEEALAPVRTAGAPVLILNPDDPGADLRQHHHGGRGHRRHRRGSRTGGVDQGQIEEVTERRGRSRRIAQGLLRPRQHPVDRRPRLVRRRVADAGQRHQRRLRRPAPTAPPPRPTTSSPPSNWWRPTPT